MRENYHWHRFLLKIFLFIPFIVFAFIFIPELPCQIVWAYQEGEDYSFKIDSYQKFDKLMTLAGEFEQSYRGPAIVAIVPHASKTDQFCQSLSPTECLKRPIFIKEGSFNYEHFLSLLKELYPKAFGPITNASQLFTGVNRIYDAVAIHRIHQSPDPAHPLYGFEHEYQTTALLTVEELNNIRLQINPVFTLGELYFYPDLTSTMDKFARNDLIKQWTAPFPIFYETLWRYDIKSAEDLQFFVGEQNPDFTIQGYVPMQPNADLHCQDLAQKGVTNCLTKTIFFHPNDFTWHGGLLRTYSEQQFLAEGQDIYSIFNADEKRIYMFFEMYHKIEDPPFVYTWTIFWHGQNTKPTLEELKRAYQELSTHFKAGQLFFFRSNASQSDDLISCENPPFPLSADDCGAGGIKAEFIPYNLGVGYGRVRMFNTLNDYELYLKNNRITWQDILVFGEPPLDIEAPFAGSVTTTSQQRDLTHLTLRAARRNVPNAYAKNALEIFKPYDGQLVKITVGETDYTVVAANLTEAEAWWNSKRPKIKPPLPIDPLYKNLDRLTEINDAPEVWFSRFGGKVSNLAKLYRFLDPKYQIEAFAIPYYYFLSFMKTNVLKEDFFNSFSHIDSVQPPISFWEYAQHLTSDEHFQNDSKFRNDVLNDFYHYGRDYGVVVDSDLALSLETRIKSLWHSDERGYYSDIDNTQKSVRVRFRSSSNMEDGVEFNGAGLYESTTVCLPDQLDADELGPSICDAEDKKERTIERALKKVWMSLYLPRAWDEREYYQLSQNKAVMAILVDTGNPDELANGVALTGDPLTPQPINNLHNDYRKYYVINVQKGDLSVVDPPFGVVAETDLISVYPNKDFNLIENISKINNSSEIGPEENVLREYEYEELAKVMLQVENEFYNPKSEVYLNVFPYPQNRVIFDLEFKFTRKGLIFKQVRPYLIGAAIPLDPNDIIFPEKPTGLKISSVSSRKVELSWTSPISSNQDQYLIERGLGQSNDFELVGVAAKDKTSFIDLTVQPAQQYQYRIKAENRFGESQPSEVLSLKTLPPGFIRGDADGDGHVSIADPIYILRKLFLDSTLSFDCSDAADSNDDGQINITDAIYILNFLFTGQVSQLPQPYPAPGTDPTLDGLTCNR